MQRRAFIYNTALLALVAGISADSCINGMATTESIKKLEGKPDRQKLIFLLRRATLGFTQSQLQELEGKDAAEIVDILLNDSPVITEPLNFEFPDDRLVPIGKSWLLAPYRTDVFYEQYRKKSLRAWLLSFTYQNPCSLRQQMMYFWLNYYAVSDVIEHKYEHRHLLYLHDNAWGNFKQITSDITIDPAMLRFLSGFENTKENPNENYARELLELFTLGRGEIKGKGDYTHFSEKDIRQIARVMTGWKDCGWFTEDPVKKIGVEFNEASHDSGTKQLSAHFDNMVIDNGGAEEFKSVIALIFAKKQTALHFTRRLYRWFCTETISAGTEKEIIEPLAQLLINSNFEIKPVLKALLTSQHFFSLAHDNARIKNPLHFTFELLHFFPMQIPADVTRQYNFWSDMFENLRCMGMELLKPPSVAGWKAYYQAPAYGKLWINSASLQARKKLVTHISFSEGSFRKHGVNISFNDVQKQIKAAGFEALFSYFNTMFFAGQLGPEIKQTARKVFETIPSPAPANQSASSETNRNEHRDAGFNQLINYLFNLPIYNLH